MRLLIALVAFALLAAGCTGGDSSSEPTTIAPTSTVLSDSTTTTAANPTTVAPATSPGVTAPEVAAAVEAQFQHEWDYYLRYDPPGPTDSPVSPSMPRGVVGPVDITCDLQGEVGFGDVLTCEAVPLEDRESYPDPFSMVILVTGEDGSAAHRRGDLENRYQTVGNGLFCRDLIGEETFSVNYFLVVGYWFREGRPDRMDADKDGIPCETVYPLAAIAEFWKGTPYEATTGIHFGYLTDLTSIETPYEVTIDYGIMLGGMEANLAAEEAGFIQPGEGVPNDFFIVNENPQLRTFELAADAEVSLITTDREDGLGPIQVDPNLWVVLFEAAGRCEAADWLPSECADFGGEDWQWFGRATLPYWIQVEGDGIIRIEEQYLP